MQSQEEVWIWLGNLAFMGLFTRVHGLNSFLHVTALYLSLKQLCICLISFSPPSWSIDVHSDWQLYRLSAVFQLQFVSACHPIRRLSPGSGTNPTGHYEAGLIPRTAAPEAFQGGFQSMIPCLSHASVGFRQGYSALL